ncbi:MAG: HipA family kinase [Saprospiraceae bacterium]
MKIFPLPEVIALQSFGVAESGANKPLFIRGVELGNRKSGDYVLKYRGAERMDEGACQRELLAAWLATEMKISTPSPVVVHVTSQFVETLRGKDVYANVSKSIGLNFGTRYVPANLPLRPGQLLSPEQERQAARIFVFDQLIRNADRNERKPNLFLANEQIFAIDHELAFDFLFILPSLLNPVAWQLNDTDVNAAKNHFFFPSVYKRSKTLDWEAVYEPFFTVNLDWTQFASECPPAWHDATTLDKIKTRINTILTNIEKFKSELWNKLLAS